MLFNSPEFLFAFLPVVDLVFWRLKSRNSRYAWLALTGYVFYGFWSWSFCLLMAFSTLVSYSAGLLMSQARSEKRRRVWLIVPIVVDLLLLSYFKYFDFLIETINGVLSTELPLFHIILPIGISFYTFHTISYIVDCYRGEIEPTRNLLEFAAYVSLFSQLVAGPIIRFSELRADLESIDVKRRADFTATGWSFFALGMIEKVVLADTLAKYIAEPLRTPGEISTGTAWLCALGYSYQLLLDFAGYSNMAIGLGLLFGMHIPRNFHRPYQALNPSDFWRRWHISLSRCLRDYIYIPLGGNRRGRVRMDANLMLTMLIGGLWHGPSWTFVIWGGYHGALLILYRQTARWWDALPSFVQRAGMFLLVVIGWCLFRAESFSAAAALLGRMFWLHTGTVMAGALPFGLTLAAAAVITHVCPSTSELSHRWTYVQAIAIGVLFTLALLLIIGGTPSPFLYFQF